MKNIIVTGASGQIGQVFVGHLSKVSYSKVYALDLDFSDTDRLDNVDDIKFMLIYTLDKF